VAGCRGEQMRHGIVQYRSAYQRLVRVRLHRRAVLSQLSVIHRTAPHRVIRSARRPRRGSGELGRILTPLLRHDGLPALVTHWRGTFFDNAILMSKGPPGMAGVDAAYPLTAGLPPIPNASRKIFLRSRISV